MEYKDCIIVTNNNQAIVLRATRAIVDNNINYGFTAFILTGRKHTLWLIHSNINIFLKVNCLSVKAYTVVFLHLKIRLTNRNGPKISLKLS